MLYAYREKLYTTLYGNTLIFYSLTLILILNDYSIDVLMLAIAGLSLLIMSRNIDLLKRKRVFNVLWYFLFLTTAMWLMLKAVLLTVVLFTFTLGIIGFYFAIHRIENLNVSITLLSLVFLLLATTVSISDKSYTHKWTFILLYLVITLAYFNIGRISTEEENSIRNLQGSVLEAASEPFAVQEMIYNSHDEPIDYEFIFANKAFKEMTGWKDVVGKKATVLIPNLEKHWFLKYDRIMKKNENMHYTRYSKTDNKYYDVSVFPIEQKRFAVLYTDVSEKISLKEAIRINDAIAKKREEANYHFLKETNNQLRCSINGLMGSLQLLDNYDENLIENAKYSASVLKNTIDTLSMSIQTINHSYEFKESDLEVCIKDYMFFDSSLSDYKVVNNLEQNSLLLFDEEILRMTLNVIMAHICIDNRDKPIIIYLEESSNQVVLVNIRNFDYGYTFEEKEKLFEPFHDMTYERDENILSFYQIRHILKSVGGDLEIESVLSEGSTYRISLPYQSLTLSRK